MKAHQPVAREPSRREIIINGGRDHINGYDDGEARKEYRNAERVPYIFNDEIETLGEIERLTEINNH